MDSILITSAPISASNLVAYGAAQMAPVETIRTPSRANVVISSRPSLHHPTRPQLLQLRLTISQEPAIHGLVMLAQQRRMSRAPGRRQHPHRRTGIGLGPQRWM